MHAGVRFKPTYPHLVYFRRSCTQQIALLQRKKQTGSLFPVVIPFRTPVAFWGHGSQIPSNLSPIVPQNETAALKGLIGSLVPYDVLVCLPFLCTLDDWCRLSWMTDTLENGEV